jgi:hypothetical protein
MSRGRFAQFGFATSVGVVLLVLSTATVVVAQTHQEHVHGMSHSVMPFDIAKAVHIFTMTEFGGIERVVVKDRRDADQVALIRQHLQEEAERFQHGDYSDPASLHGSDMPGLRELRLGARQIRVRYSDVPEGGDIRFETADRHLLTAIHRWFGAQLSEHGPDAKAG